MERIYRLALAVVTFLYYITASGQLISKKESGAIDNILTELSEQHKPKPYIIRNVSILTMKDSVLLRNQDVVVEDGIIKKIGTDIQNANATVIDGTGKFLMPGLTDMHVHLFDGHPLKNTWILHLIINGVTTVRDLYGSPEKLVLREKIRRNEILAPNLYQSGQIINGINDKYAVFVSTPEQSREIVLAQKKAGYDFIKVYDGLSKEVFEAIVEEAKQQNIPVVGHVPDQITISDAIGLGQQSIEHLTGYIEWEGSEVKISAGANYAGITAQSETWNCPTMYNHYLNGSRRGAADVITYAETTGLLPRSLTDMWKKRAQSSSKEVVEIVDKYGATNLKTIKEILLNLDNAKARLIAGTDSGNLPFLIPGYSLHQEVKILNEMGIPTFEVLKMTTVNAALAMNRDAEFGTVEVGKRADLLLLNSNPLDNIENLQNKGGVMIRGIWLSEAAIRQLTEKIKLAFAK